MEIVRSLLSDPQVLFLDEPTVGLDTRVRHDLFDVLATLRDQTGVTILMTTHYLDEAERLCDRIAIVDGGRIVACDTPANFLASLGGDVLDVRVDDADHAVKSLLRTGVPSDDLLAVGSTLTVSLRGLNGDQIVARLREAAVDVRSITTRHPSLDDVYLRLTGDRIAVTEQ
jgi:ABC-2 type transport system ATP-binding protein